MDTAAPKPWYKTRWAIALFVFLAVTIIAGLSGMLDEDTEATPTPTVSAPTPSEDPTPAETKRPAAVADEDITAWVKWLRPDKAELIESAIREESGDIRVHTNIVDPRVQGISPEGTDALAICIAIADQDEDRVWIYEADGTTFMYMRDGICTEP